MSCKILRIFFFELRLNKTFRFFFKANKCHVLIDKTLVKPSVSRKKINNRSQMKSKMTLRSKPNVCNVGMLQKLCNAEVKQKVVLHVMLLSFY